MVWPETVVTVETVVTAVTIETVVTGETVVTVEAVVHIKTEAKRFVCPQGGGWGNIEYCKDNHINHDQY